jgi:hypothetical protein
MISMKNLHSVSTSALAQLAGGKYYDLASSLRVMKMVFDAEAVDGFELQLLPERDKEGPPLTDAHFADWAKTPKHTIDEVAKTVKTAGFQSFRFIRAETLETTFAQHKPRIFRRENG